MGKLVHKKDVRIGYSYEVRVGDRLVEVRIDREVIRPAWSSIYGIGRTNAKTYWLGTNLATGRMVRINSAAKLRRQISP